MAKLGEICEILDSKRIPITASERVPGPYPYYGANGIQDYVSAFTKRIHEYKLTIQQSLDKLEVLKKSLMQEYFGG